jgi:hypothetical protein
MRQSEHTTICNATEEEKHSSLDLSNISNTTATSDEAKANSTGHSQNFNLEEDEHYTPPNISLLLRRYPPEPTLMASHGNDTPANSSRPGQPRHPRHPNDTIFSLRQYLYSSVGLSDSSSSELPACPTRVESDIDGQPVERTSPSQDLSSLFRWYTQRLCSSVPVGIQSNQKHPVCPNGKSGEQTQSRRNTGNQRGTIRGYRGNESHDNPPPIIDSRSTNHTLPQSTSDINKRATACPIRSIRQRFSDSLRFDYANTLSSNLLFTGDGFWSATAMELTDVQCAVWAGAAIWLLAAPTPSLDSSGINNNDEPAHIIASELVKIGATVSYHLSLLAVLAEKSKMPINFTHLYSLDYQPDRDQSQNVPRTHGNLVLGEGLVPILHPEDNGPVESNSNQNTHRLNTIGRASTMLLPCWPSQHRTEFTQKLLSELVSQCHLVSDSKHVLFDNLVYTMYLGQSADMVYEHQSLLQGQPVGDVYNPQVMFDALVSQTDQCFVHENMKGDLSQMILDFQARLTHPRSTNASDPLRSVEFGDSVDDSKSRGSTINNPETANSEKENMCNWKKRRFRFMIEDSSILVVFGQWVASYHPNVDWLRDYCLVELGWHRKFPLLYSTIRYGNKRSPIITCIHGLWHVAHVGVLFRCGAVTQALHLWCLLVHHQFNGELDTGHSVRSLLDELCVGG